ncbi:sialidase family protein [Jiangella alkaliphila]|uniref:exo-alpha-sialidase n=1 Tax=Jiangella alkaliphila TaxID=419479 RepID=A0A1H2K789_9ACTN|nr:sialidase family protein [Jiangella alkaliphila]SDU64268.1 BNR repeat-like domain-containing protein [Jiangella alkaliphila]
MKRRTFLAGAAAGLGAAYLPDVTRPAPAAARTSTGMFEDIGQISAGNHQLPTVIATGSQTLTIVAQHRYPVTTPGVNVDKGAADIVTFRSVDGGRNWSPGGIIHHAGGEAGDCGYASVVTMMGGDLATLYTAGPQNWEPPDLVLHQRVSGDGGRTWGDVSFPTVTSDHANGLPTNGGTGFTLPTGRVVVPGRACLLYSDDDGRTWTATPEFAETVETKAQPARREGMTALVPWRTRDGVGRMGRVRVTNQYKYRGTVTHDFGGDNNLGFVRYDDRTLLMTVSRDSQLYIRRSVDEGRTWIDEKLITASAPSARYSDIAVTDDGTIVVAYMSNHRVVANAAPLHVVRLDLDWLTR